MNWKTCLIVLAALPAAVCCAQTDSHKPKSPREQYEALVEQYEQLGGADKLASKFLTLAQDNAQQPVAVEALGWILINVRSGAVTKQAQELLLSKHLESEGLAAICSKLARSYSSHSEPVLRKALDASPHAAVQAAACYSLAANLQNQLKIQTELVTRPSQRRRLEQFFGREFTRRVRGLNTEEVAAEVEQLYDRVVRKYGDVDPKMTARATTQLVEIRYLTPGKLAQEIEGEDADGVRFKLSDYRGKVVMLTFWGHW